MPEFVSPVVPAGRLSKTLQPDIPVDELLLRPWRPSDAPAVVSAYLDPEIQRWHVRSKDIEEARAWTQTWADRWTAETGAGWVIVDSGKVGEG